MPDPTTEPPIVNCTWGDWGPWGPCNAWCNETTKGLEGRTRSRNRTIAQEAMNGGVNCTDEDATELRTTGDETCTDNSCAIGKDVIISIGHLLQRVAIFTVFKNSPNKIFSIFERLVGIEAG